MCLTLVKLVCFRNFFDLRGTSINIISLVNEINKHFDVNMRVADAFIRNSVRLQAEYVSELLALQEQQRLVEQDDNVSVMEW